MRTRITIVGLLLVFWVSITHAVMIGFFPGLDELIQKADAIVILRIDRHVTDFGSPTLYSTHDCYVYQTLKGGIQAGKTIRLQLMDTRHEFATPYASLSTHLMFLTKKRTADEPTEYRTIEFRGANIRLPPLGHEKMPEGKTTKDQITSLLKTTLEYNQKQHERESAFLDQMIKGTPEPRGPSNGSQPIRSESNRTSSGAVRIFYDKTVFVNADGTSTNFREVPCSSGLTASRAIMAAGGFSTPPTRHAKIVRGDKVIPLHLNVSGAGGGGGDDPILKPSDVILLY